MVRLQLFVLDVGLQLIESHIATAIRIYCTMPMQAGNGNTGDAGTPLPHNQEILGFQETSKINIFGPRDLFH